MFRLGVLDEDGVRNAYLDVGYSPENAELMLEFTVAYEADELTGVTRASVISAFKKGIITVKQLQEYLEAFGYTDEVVSFWLSMAVYEKTMDENDLIVQELENRYLMGILTIEQVQTELNKYDLPASYISEIISSLRLKASKKVKLPTKADLHDWLDMQLINENEYHNRMSMLGYPQEDVEIYLSEIAHEKDTEKPKYLPVKTYQRWFISGIIMEERFTEILRKMGFSAQDVANLVLETKQQMEA